MVLAVSFVVFVAASTMAGLVLSMIYGSLSTVIAWCSLAAGLAAGLVCRVCCRDLEVPRLRLGWSDAIFIFFFSLFCLRHFLWIYFYREGALWTWDTYNLGDLPYHLTHIATMVAGSEFWPENPIFSGQGVHYPFGIDLWTALFVRVGIPLETILPVSGLALAAVLLYVLLRWAGSFGVAAFLFSGGAAGLAVLGTGLIQDYQYDLAWKSIPLAIWIPQRGFHFAFPAGLLILWSWRRRWLQEREGLPAVLEGFLWGVMPFFHFHTFLFLSVIFLVWGVSSRKFSQAATVLLWAIAPATVFVLVLTNVFQLSSMIWFKPGWLIGDENPIWFLWVNFGLFVPLAVWALASALRNRSRDPILLIVPGLVLFVLLFFVVVSAWEWDNTKVMVWCYLLVVAGIQGEIMEKRRGVEKVFIYVLVFLSGFITVLSSLGPSKKGVELARVEEMDGVCHAVRHLDSQFRFATAQVYNHPVALCGRKLVAGYGGHLWSHGIDSADVEGRLRRLMLGEPGWEADARELEARYLFWGHREEKQFPDSRRPWDIERMRIAEGRWGTVYDLS